MGNFLKHRKEKKNFIDASKQALDGQQIISRGF